MPAQRSKPLQAVLGAEAERPIIAIGSRRPRSAAGQRLGFSVVRVGSLVTRVAARSRRQRLPAERYQVRAALPLASDDREGANWEIGVRGVFCGETTKPRERSAWTEQTHSVQAVHPIGAD